MEWKNIEMTIEKEQEQLLKQFEVNGMVLQKVVKPSITELKGLTSEQAKEKEKNNASLLHTKDDKGTA